MIALPGGHRPQPQPDDDELTVQDLDTMAALLDRNQSEQARAMRQKLRRVQRAIGLRVARVSIRTRAFEVE